MFDQVLAFYRQWSYFRAARPAGPPDFHSFPFTLDPRYHESAFVTARAEEWIEEHGREKPFFLHVGYAADLSEEVQRSVRRLLDGS